MYYGDLAVLFIDVPTPSRANAELTGFTVRVDVLEYQTPIHRIFVNDPQLYLFEATEVANSLTETSAEKNVYKFTADDLLSYGIELKSPADAYCGFCSENLLPMYAISPHVVSPLYGGGQAEILGGY